MSEYGNKAVKVAAGLGCLVSIAGPFLAILLYPIYPKAKWLSRLRS